MLVYGGSVKRSGLYDIVVAELNDAGIPLLSFGGVQPNSPPVSGEKGPGTGKRQRVRTSSWQWAAAASSIRPGHCAGHGIGDDFGRSSRKKLVPTQMAPVGTIHTISATGSETSRSSVIKDDLDTQHKFGFMLEPCRPVFALMNPEWTITPARLPDGGRRVGHFCAYRRAVLCRGRLLSRR